MNNTVEFARSFRKFFIFVLFCAFAGNIIGRSVQKILDDKWQLFSRSLYEKKIQISRPLVLFSRAGLPTLGALVESLSYKTEANCFEYEVTAEQLFLPLNLFKIVLGDFEFGTLQVEKTRIEFKESLVCLSEREKHKEQPPTKTSDGFEDVLNQVNVHLEPTWFDQLSLWFSTHHPRIDRMPIKHFLLKQIEILGENHKEKKLNALGRLSVDLDEVLRADVEFEKLVLGKTTRSVATKFQAEISASSEQIQFFGDWTYDEGHLKAEVSYAKSTDIQFRLKSENFPLSVLNRWFDTQWTFQFIWFNCELSLNSSKENWALAPWKTENCHVSSPYGQIQLTSQSLPSLEKLEPIEVKVTNLQLDEIFKGKQLLPASNILKDFGVLNGSLKTNQGRIESQWQLVNSSVIFSKRNKRLLQSLESVDGTFRYSEGTSLINFLDVKIKEGLFKGKMELSYNKRNQSLRLSTQIDQLAFNPEIQKLMTAGELSPISIYGEMESSTDFSKYDGKFQLKVDQYVGPSFKALDVSVLLGWIDGTPQMALTASRLQLEKSEETRWFFASLLEESLGRSQIQLQQIYSKGHLQLKKQFVVEKSTGFVPSLGRFSLSGKMNWLEGQGKAQWQLNKGHFLDWEWSYRPQDSTWIPQKKEMYEWLTSHEEFMEENPFIH
ncbi:hypothetical protein K2X05_01365 [bacterium]|nr:hypothetical protein [bacterium]